MGFLTVDNKHKNFVLRVPFHFNYLAQKAPSRRFMKKTREWFLPTLRMNAQYLKNTVIPNVDIATDQRVIDLIDEIMEKTQNVYTPFPIWYSFKKEFEPMEKQMEALNKAWGKQQFCFAMDMGTGKTKIYIELGTALYVDGKIDAVVVLTKNSVVNKILREVDKHCPLNERICFAPTFENSKKNKKQLAEFSVQKNKKLKFMSMGIESFSNGEGKGKAFGYLWDFVVKNKTAIFVDESHMIKTPKSIRTKNITAIGGMCDYRYIGTGTLTPQGLMDLYAQYRFLNPDIIGLDNFFSFKNRYAVMGGYKNKEIIGYDNIEELMNLVKPWTIQISKEEMVDLPSKVYTEPIIVEMTNEQKRKYKEIKNLRMTELQKLDGKNIEIMAESILQVYGLLRQISSGFISYDDTCGQRRQKWLVEPNKNPKYSELLLLLNANPNRQFTIWTCFLMELHAVYKYLNDNGQTVTKLHGAMNREERDRSLIDFETGKSKHLIATQETGGTGLDFIHSSNVIYLSNTFKYVDRAQSEDRNHRKGITNKVIYTDLIVKDSPDEHILEALRHKQDFAKYVLGKLKENKPLLTIL